MTAHVHIIGAGLAGTEAAWQLAELGIDVRLSEMKPTHKTPAQHSDLPAELVCSNSLRSNNPQNAVGLLKEEMRRLHSLVIEAAYEAKVPAGDALAVEREVFSKFIAKALRGHPNIHWQDELVQTLPEAPCDDGPCKTIVATGPLTHGSLATSIAEHSGGEGLYFYDSLAPIVSAESLDRSVIFAQSRYDKGDGEDYLNIPLDKETYERFVEALLQAESMPLHDFEEPKYFEGCLPIEVVASRGEDALRYGCMKPVGLRDPRSDKRPYAVIQLRKEDKAGQAYNIVGFQTKLKYPEQQRILRSLPGLQNAVFLRLGAIHRNTYLDAPTLLDAQMALGSLPHVHFAGQITGVEGYVESAAHGLLTARLVAGMLNETPFEAPPATTALGALYRHVRGENRAQPGRGHEPQNVNWSMVPPLPLGIAKHERKRARTLRAVADFEGWAQAQDVVIAPGRVDETTLPVMEPRTRQSRRQRKRQRAQENPS